MGSLRTESRGLAMPPRIKNDKARLVIQRAVYYGDAARFVAELRAYSKLGQNWTPGLGDVVRKFGGQGGIRDMKTRHKSVTSVRNVKVLEGEVGQAMTNCHDQDSQSEQEFNSNSDLNLSEESDPREEEEAVEPYDLPTYFNAPTPAPLSFVKNEHMYADSDSLKGYRSIATSRRYKNKVITTIFVSLK